MSNKTVLMLAATPPDHPKLSLAEEHDEIKDLLQKARRREAFALEVRAAAEWDDFRDEILDKNPSVVHFSGHGAGAKGLLLTDKAGNSRLAATDELTELFKQEENEIECVLLNACMSLEQAVEIVKYVPYVIGMKQEIGDAAAVDFARGFYRAYFADKSVGTSFKWGCAEIRGESLKDEHRRHVGSAKPVADLPEDLKPILLIRPDVFVACHEEIDIPVQQELFKDLRELEVVGDWLCRKDDRIPGGRALSFGAARDILVALTNKWCQEVYAAETPFRVTPDDPRVRAILWEKCDLPIGFEKLSRFDFQDVKIRPVVIQHLVAAFKRKTRATLPQTAAVGIQAARELTQAPEVLDAGKRVKKTLKETLGDLEDLDRWKTLHARMHHVAVGIPSLTGALEQLKGTMDKWADDPRENERRRAIEQGWRTAKLASDKIKAGLSAIIEYGGSKTFSAKDFPKGQLQGAATALENLFDARALQHLPEALFQVRTLLEQHMTNVDKRLFESAEKVPLQSLVENLSEILVSTETLPGDAETTARIAAFRNGVEAIRELRGRLQALVVKHSYLQNIANRMNLLNDENADPLRISMTMTIVSADCKQLLDEVKDAWVEEFGRRFSAVTAAIPPAPVCNKEEDGPSNDEDVWRLRYAVMDMINHLEIGFFQADESLKNFCDELEGVRNELDKMIEGL